jgi:hypothetical protein
MMGKIKSVPTRAKPWLAGGEEASQIEMWGGTMCGQMLIAIPE